MAKLSSHLLANHEVTLQWSGRSISLLLSIHLNQHRDYGLSHIEAIECMKPIDIVNITELIWIWLTVLTVRHATDNKNRKCKTYRLRYPSLNPII